MKEKIGIVLIIVALVLAGIAFYNKATHVHSPDCSHGIIPNLLSLQECLDKECLDKECLDKECLDKTTNP